MGVFDNVQCDAMRCPLCGAQMDWQSKSGPCLLEEMTVHQLMDHTNKPVFYADCRDCSVWVEVAVERRTPDTPAQRLQYRKERDILARKRQQREGTITDDEH